MFVQLLCSWPNIFLAEQIIFFEMSNRSADETESTSGIGKFVPGLIDF